MPRENRNWEPILRDAAARGIGPVPLAREQNCDSAAVYWAEKHYGITLPRRRDGAAPTFAAPFVPAETEEWRYIDGWNGRYSASSFGRIRNNHTGHTLSPHINNRGYMQLSLFRPKAEGGAVTFKVHRLIAIAYLSNPDGLPHVNHRDCDKTNNSAINLEWTTFDENFSHGRESGRALAVLNPNVRHKLSAEDVASIRRRYAAGEDPVTIAADYPQVSRSHIGKVAIGRARKHEAGAAQQRPRPVSKKPKPLTTRPRKMTPARVVALRAMAAGGATRAQCAEAFGLSYIQASKIVSRRSWRHVPDVSLKAPPSGEPTNE